MKPVLSPDDSIFEPANLGGVIVKLSPTPGGGAEVVAWTGSNWVPADIPASEVLAGPPVSEAMLKREGLLNQ